MNKVNSSPVRADLYLFFFVSVVLLTSIASAKPTLQGFSPRAIQVGSTSEFTAKGSFATWPVTVWSDRPGLQFKPGEKGKLTITAPKGVSPGIYLIRFLDSTGASEPIPLVVDFAESTLEKEPNESPKQPNVLNTPVNVTEVLGKSGDVDCFQIDCKKGQTLMASVRANPLFGTTMDGIVQICDSRGFVLDQNDDKLGMDPQLLVKVPNDGKYFVRIFAFPAAPNSTVRFAGGADYRYLLTISTEPTFLHPRILSDQQKVEQISMVGINQNEKPIMGITDLGKSVVFYAQGTPGFFELAKSADPAMPIKESEQLAKSVIQIPFDLTGVVSQKGELDLVRFTGQKGEKIRFRIDARKLGFELDPVLTIFDENGKSLLNKDDNAKTDPDLVVDFSPSKDGEYFARVKDSADAGGADYYYRFRAEKVKADFDLTVANSSFEIVGGKKLELEVTIHRKDGFNQPIEIHLEGLGEELKVKSVISEPKGDSAKKVKLTLETKTALQKFFRIVGKSKDVSRYATLTLPCQRNLNQFVLTSVVAGK